MLPCCKKNVFVGQWRSEFNWSELTFFGLRNKNLKVYFGLQCKRSRHLVFLFVSSGHERPRGVRKQTHYPKKCGGHFLFASSSNLSRRSGMKNVERNGDVEMEERRDVQCVLVEKRNKSHKHFFQKHFPLFIQRKKRSFHPKQENKIKQTYNINNNNNNQSLRG